MKKFNTTAVCIPSKHYMVDLSGRVIEIKKLVDDGKYFCINRARQYGKTTTISSLATFLSAEYLVVSISFEGIGNEGFKSEQAFVKAFCRKIKRECRNGLVLPDDIRGQLDDYIARKEEKAQLDELFDTLLDWCSKEDKKIVLIIDEVDSATDNQVFLDFLGQLRDNYISRDTKGTKTFQSVILAGVTDVKHLKAKIRPEDAHKENSPWNIAADFDIDMSLSEPGIKGMLDEYEADHHTGMDTAIIAKQIRAYTNGYPYLVSRICQLIDEQFVSVIFPSLTEAWTAEGVEQAVKTIITEKNTLFDSLMGKIREYERLREQLGYMLLRGETLEYLPDNKEQEQLMMYGFIVNDHNTVAVANRIFEMRLYRYFVGESRFSQEMRKEAIKDKPEFIKGGELDVPLIMERFIASQKIVRNMMDEKAEEKYIEEEGRERFLTYLSPIINGVGTYSVEDRSADSMRMDVVIHYNGKRYIIEMKIWHGERYNQRGEKQIIEYLNRFGLITGYMLSFSFNKNKEPGVKRVHIGDKLLYEGIV